MIFNKIVFQITSYAHIRVPLLEVRRMLTSSEGVSGSIRSINAVIVCFASLNYFLKCYCQKYSI